MPASPFPLRLEDAAVVDEHGPLAGTALRQAIDATAAALRAAGVQPRDVVGLALHAARAIVPAAVAAWELGAVPMLVPPALGPAELGAVGAGLPPRLVLAEREDADRLAAGLDADAVPLDLADLPALALLRPRSGAAATVDGALIRLSSGSTGLPKAVVYDAANCAAEAAQVCEALRLAAGDRIVVPVPLTHAYGFDVAVLAGLTAGAIIDQRSARSPRRIAADMADATIYLGTPAMFRLVAQAPFASPPDLTAARFLFCATAPLSAELTQRFAARFGVSPCQLYGSSEAGVVTIHDPDRVEGRPASIGRALPGVRLSLDERTGELVVHSRAVARGYLLGAPPESPFGEATFRSGDLAEIDAEGFVRLGGRINGLINVGGLKVSPQEVAESLERHAAVRQAAVVGLPDGHGDELVAALVVLAAPVPEAELVAHCAGELAEHKVPRRVVVRETLPVGPTGKVRVRPEDLA